MQRRNMRVMVASEYPEVQYFLREVVEGGDGAVIVGQAENVTKALTLAQNLRPDIAIIDSYLPHIIGLDAVPLSRIGGLDTAQAISREIPDMRVIFLSDLYKEPWAERGLSQDNAAFFFKKTTGSNTLFTLQELYREALSPGAVIFADIEVKQRTALWQKIAGISGKVALFGVFGILGGLALILTVVLAPAGVVLAAAGAVAAVLGLTGKLATTTRAKGFLSRAESKRNQP